MMDVNPPAVEEAPPPTSALKEEQDGAVVGERPLPEAPAASEESAVMEEEQQQEAGKNRRTPRRATEGIKPWMVHDDVEEESADPNEGKRPCRLCRVSKVSHLQSVSHMLVLSCPALSSPRQQKSHIGRRSAPPLVRCNRSAATAGNPAAAACAWGWTARSRRSSAAGAG